MKKIAILRFIEKEFLEMIRSGIIRFLIIAPVIQVIIFGYVATTDIKNVKTLICDEDVTAESRRLIDKFKNSEYFNLLYKTPDQKEIERKFRENKIVIAIRIPAGFSEKIKEGKRAKVQVIVDGSDSNMSLISLNRAIMIINGFSNDVFAERVDFMKKSIGSFPSVDLRERIWYNPELKSANTMVPGVVALILVVVTLVVTSLAIVREKETGNIEQILVTPVTPAEIIAGKIIPYILIALVDIVLIVGISMAVFRIPFEGSFVLFLSLSFFMILTNLGIGIYVSTVSETQQQAMLTAVFFILPNILLSGFLFPIKNMPEILQVLTFLIPMRYYMVIVRGVFLKGLGFAELLPETLALFVFGVIIFTLAIKQFRKTIG